MPTPGCAGSVAPIGIVALIVIHLVVFAVVAAGSAVIWLLVAYFRSDKATHPTFKQWMFETLDGVTWGIDFF